MLEAIIDKALLEDVARMAPSPLWERQGGTGDDVGGGFDLERWIEEHDVEVVRTGAWDGGGRKWILKKCPWNGHTDNSAYIAQFSNGAIAAGCHHNSCSEYRWHDLREHYEPGCYDGAGFGETRKELGSTPLAPRGDAEQLPSVPRLPVEVLPRAMRNLVEAAAASIGCPPDFIAVPMLTVLGAAIGNSRVLKVKSGWSEGATVYSAVVAAPGQKKSPAFKEATAPAWKRQQEYRREYDEAMADYGCEKRAWEAEKKRATNDGEPAPPPPDEPVMGRMVVDDATVESLMDRLEDNPRGLSCVKDELSGWVRGLDQYKGGKGSDRQFFLTVWSNSPVVIDRKGRKGPVMLQRPFLALTGGIQPEVLPELSNGRDDGLLDRILYCYPEEMPSRWSDDEVSDETKAAYKSLYDRLYDLRMEEDEDGSPRPRPVEFTPEAKAVFVEQVNSLGEETEQAGFPKYLKGPWAKLEAYLARLSLILAMVRIVEEANEPRSEPMREFIGDGAMVTQTDVKAAAALIEYFKAHARKVYAKLHGEKPENLLREDLKAFVRESGGNWEGTVKRLYGVLEARSTPGMPGGVVPLGKLLRKFAREGDKGLTVEFGHAGKEHIVRLSSGTSGPGHATEGEEAAVGVTEGTEGKISANDVDPDAEDGEEFIDSEGQNTEFTETDDAEEEVEGPEDAPEAFDLHPEDEAYEVRVRQVVEVLRLKPEYRYADPEEIIEEESFVDLDFEPTPEEVEMGQWLMDVEDETI